MSIAATVAKVVTTLIKPVADAYIKRQDRKQAKESAKSKLQQAKQSDATKIELTDAEGEAVLAAGLSDTWKDEYATVSVVSILNLTVLGGLEAVVRGDEAVLLSGLTISFQAMSALGVDLGFLLTAVVLAAIGLKVWRI